MRTARQIRRFITTALLDEPFDGDDPLAEEILDSLAVEQLVAHLEDSYGITFDDEDVTPENFADIATLAGLVDEKRRAAKAARP